MPNPVKGEVALKLGDGREFVLVLDMEALVEAEGAYGKPLQQMMQDASAGFVGAIRAMLYGALRAKHPEVNLRDASELFRTDMDAVSSALANVSATAFPKAGGGTEGKEPAHPPGNGSGLNGAKPASTRKRSGAQPPALSA